MNFSYNRTYKHFKKLLSFILALYIFTSLFINNTKISATEKSDFSVVLEVPEKTASGEQVTLKVSITDIVYPEFKGGQGIFGASVFLYYDSDIFTLAEDGFSASAPPKWDSFEGKETPGVLGLYTVFDGNLKNGATKDGDITFTVTFDVSSSARKEESEFYIANCECTGYKSTSIVLVDSFEASAYCNEKIKINLPPFFVSSEDSPLVIDTDNGIIYSQTPAVNYPTFVSFFSYMGSLLNIKAYDYEITEENGYFIPAGANITFSHIFSEKTLNFKYYLLGDCNRNGTITAEDLEVIKWNIVNRLTPEGHDKYAMDLDKDGEIHIADYYILKFNVIKD